MRGDVRAAAERPHVAHSGQALAVDRADLSGATSLTDTTGHKAHAPGSNPGWPLHLQRLIKRPSKKNYLRPLAAMATALASPANKLNSAGVNGGRSELAVCRDIILKDCSGSNKAAGKISGRVKKIELPTQALFESQKSTSLSAAGSGPLNTTKHLLAGAVAAMISRTTVAPLERLKLEYIVGGRKDSVVVAMKDIFQKEGLGGFWKGNLVNLLRTAPFKSLNFFAFDLYRKRIIEITGKSDVSNAERLGAGAAAGITATVLCFPMDTIRTRMVAQGGLGFNKVAQCAALMVRTEGIASLYRGLLPAVVSMAPAGAVFYGTYDFLKTAYLSSPKGIAETRLRAADVEAPARWPSAGGEPTPQSIAGVAPGAQVAQAAGKSGFRSATQHMELGAARTLLYGAIAGACAEAATYPFEVVRRHLQLQARAQRAGFFQVVKVLVEREGVGALYAGLLPSTLQVLPSAALSYFVYEFLKANMKVNC
eukprot:jgi/Mesen1/6033/ME000308S05224